MKRLSQLTALILCLTLLSRTALGAGTTDLRGTIRQAGLGLAVLGSGKPVLTQGNDFPAGTSVCDWTAMALALSGAKEDYKTYLEALETYVEEAYAKDGSLDAVKSTTYHRISLTVLALGGDPTTFGQKPDGTAIDLVADGTYAFAGDSLGLQGLNGWICALLTLDASGEAVPADARFTLENMLENITAAQEPDGGFGLVQGGSDVDITAMALQSLAPYRIQYPDTVERGLEYLAGTLNENCGYVSYGAENAESTAQVILALCALGIDPEEDSRFVKGENTLLTQLLRFRQSDGTFSHQLTDSTGDHLATAQCLLALIATAKLRDQEGWLWDFAAYAGPQQKAAVPWSHILGVIVIPGAIAAYIIIARKRKKHGKTN